MRSSSMLARSGGFFALALTLGGCGGGSTTPPPDGPPFKLTDFESPESCAGCHPNHYAEWAGSMHAYSFKDPLFFAMNFAEHTRTGGALGQFCIGCHSPIGTLTGTTPDGVFDPESMPDIVRAGISCDLCHTIIGPTDGATEAGTPLALQPGDTKFGPLPPLPGEGFHRSEQRADYRLSGICRACHNLTVRGIGVEETFNEWENSLYASTEQHCQFCHMPAYSGQAAVGGPIREVHRHSFTGADVALTPFPDSDSTRARVADLLSRSASLSIAMPDTVAAGDTLEVTVTVINDRTGHALPSGTSFSRQMWIEIVATAPGADTLYASGTLDGNMDLRDAASDPDLVNFTTVLEGGEDVTVFSATGIQNRLIPPGLSRSADYRVPVPVTEMGPLQVAVRLRFRAFPPFKARRLGHADLVPVIPIFEMAEATRQVAVN